MGWTDAGILLCAADPVHLMFDQVVEKYLPKAVMLGPDSWLTGSETGFASCKSFADSSL